VEEFMEIKGNNRRRAGYSVIQVLCTSPEGMLEGPIWQDCSQVSRYSESTPPLQLDIP
jgi:hypothetical protein